MAGAVGGTQALELTRTYHGELQAALPVLRCVQEELGRNAYRLTECRLLDIYLWAYSNTYEPLWQRRQRGAASTPKPPAPCPSPEKAPQGRGYGGVGAAPQEFWSDDEGYLEWLSSHAAGYVVNCERQPKASYLKLHRASCSWLHLLNVRSWTNPYMKVCATSASTLDNWATSRTSTNPDRCPRCKP